MDVLYKPTGLNSASYGTIQVSFDNKNITIFDDYEMNVTSGAVLGLPLTDYGWTPRKLYIVNRGNVPAGFNVVFTSAVTMF